MRKWIVALVSLCVLLCAACGAQAAGVTLRTFTPFADVDFAAQSYMDMITAWEKETGNVVEDYSGAMDETWMETFMRMLKGGEVDVVVVPSGLGLSQKELLTAGELASSSDCGARQFASMKEADGSMLLAPVRLYWEALYVNTDVLARYGLAVPQTFEQLLSVCSTLAQNGVLPIANALCEWNETVLDCAALMGAPAEQYGQKASLDGAKDVLTALVQAKAFGSDPWNMTDADAESKFLSGEAAMRFDADVLAQLVPAQRADSVVVVNVPAKDGQARSEVVGMATYGVAVTRACWKDSARSEAAASFITKLLEETSLQTPAGGKLGESIAALSADATNTVGVLYDYNPDGFEDWAESVIAHLMSL